MPGSSNKHVTKLRLRGCNLTLEIQDSRFDIWYDLRLEIWDIRFEIWDYRLEILDDLRFEMWDLRWFDIWYWDFRWFEICD